MKTILISPENGTINQTNSKQLRLTYCATIVEAEQRFASQRAKRAGEKNGARHEARRLKVTICN